MKSSNPAWARTTNENLAAAISVLGLDIESDQTVDSTTGQGWKTLLLGMEGVPEKAIGLKSVRTEAGEDTGEEPPAVSIKTGALLTLLRNGDLAKADPYHPSLDVLRACAAADALEDACKTGTHYRLARVKDVLRYQLVAGEEPQSVKENKLLWRTRNLKLAACLSILSYPLARIFGDPGGQHEFLFNIKAYGFDDQPTVPINDLAQHFRAGRLPEGHPLPWMMQGLTNRDGIRDFRNKQEKLVLMRAEGTGRCSLVPESFFKDGDKMDAVKRHLRIR